MKRRARFEDPKLESEIDNIVNSVNEVVKNLKADIEVITDVKVEGTGTFTLSTKSSIVKIFDGKISVDKSPNWKKIKEWS